MVVLRLMVTFVLMLGRSSRCLRLSWNSQHGPQSCSLMHLATSSGSLGWTVSKWTRGLVTEDN